MLRTLSVFELNNMPHQMHMHAVLGLIGRLNRLI